MKGGASEHNVTASEEVLKELDKQSLRPSTQKKVEQALGEAAERRTKKGPKSSVELEEARELFGKDFLGPEAIQKTFQVEFSPKELEAIECIPFSREDLEQAKSLGMMLVLRAGKDERGDPLTLNRMRELFEKGDRLGDPKKKKSRVFCDQSWYDNEDFATKATTQLGWGLVMKDVLPESLGKNWSDQQRVLEEWAQKNNLDPATVHRRTPVEVVYDLLAYYGGNKEALLENRWDWTATESYDGPPVLVGSFDSDGLNVNPGSREISESYLGVCPAR